MVVCIVALLMLSGIIKTAVMGRSVACSGQRSNRRSRRRNRREGGEAAMASQDDLATLNARLETVIDRLAVLEKIVTDEDVKLKREFADLERETRDIARHTGPTA